MTPMAFYAPLKAPTHPTPSGDRALARALMLALEHAGFAPTLASDLRCLDTAGDTARQQHLFAQAKAALPDIIAKGRQQGWRAWLTYHNYYKAPDLLGPAVADALDIPYVQVESTRARKRLQGPWAAFAATAEAAAERADAILYFTHRDAEALQAYAPPTQRLVHLRPFLPRADLPPVSTRTGPILVAAMMRHGDKLDSYRLIADTLHLLNEPFHLAIAGDGVARMDVERLMHPFGDKVRFLGKLDPAQMAAAYSEARLLFWPGVNEAIGLTYLEAQAAGVPILAQDRPGLRDVLPPGHGCPRPQDGAQALALRLSELLAAPPPPQVYRTHITDHHLLPAAADTLRATLEGIV